MEAVLLLEVLQSPEALGATLLFQQFHQVAVAAAALMARTQPLAAPAVVVVATAQIQVLAGRVMLEAILL